jgi:acyl-CoA reductase-like NAD-dependent aldehyde dehydrogenase
MFSNSGQVCAAAKRVYVHADVYDTLRDELVHYADSLNIGNGLDEDVQLGPIQNEMQYKRIQ